MKYFFYVLLSLFLVGCVSKNVEPLSQVEEIIIENPVDSGFIASDFLEFDEIWAYLNDGQENLYHENTVVTDIGYFGAGLNTFGKLVGIPNPEKIRHLGKRIHLVVADNGRALTHFCISSEFTVRDKLIESIVKASEKFDGVQIDFEYVSKEDREDYISFLKDLRSKLPNKIFSVAIPARMRKLENDIHDYQIIAPIVDKMLIMAYDEHWSTSKPGPIASIDWCKRIAMYAQNVIPEEKLIMGCPFYARAWANTNPARAYRFSTLCNVANEEKIDLNNVLYIDEIPTFIYEKKVNVTVFFENAKSNYYRLKMYKDLGITNVGFWCLGQEDVAVWNFLKVSL